MCWERVGGGDSARVVRRERRMVWFSRALALGTASRFVRGARAGFAGDTVMVELVGVRNILKIGYGCSRR